MVVTILKLFIRFSATSSGQYPFIGRIFSGFSSFYNIGLKTSGVNPNPHNINPVTMPFLEGKNFNALSTGIKYSIPMKTPGNKP